VRRAAVVGLSAAQLRSIVANIPMCARAREQKTIDRIGVARVIADRFGAETNLLLTSGLCATRLDGVLERWLRRGGTHARPRTLGKPFEEFSRKSGHGREITNHSD
jgi:hypothetical protein